MSVVAGNRLQETSPKTVTFEMVGQVRGLTIDDREEITSVRELKFFFLEFESLGAGTCIFIDFKDGVQNTFGDASYCAEWMPAIEYVPGTEMLLPIQITHTYEYERIFKQ